MFSQLMGRPWLPYQRYIADVAGELLEDGRYAHHTIVVTTPRQSGKTTAAYDSMLGRGRRYPGFRARYTTHQGTITTKLFGEWFNELERNQRIGSQVKLRRSQGTEGITWRPTRSYFQAFPPRDGALRSQALDAVVVDEAQEHDEVTGAGLRRTIRPVFSTRARAQLWIVFTAGTDQSTYARAYLDAALAGTPGYALFDYGCPLDVDPLDEDQWLSWHPGLAYGLTTTEKLHAALTEDPAAFTREFGNRWTRTRTQTIDPDDWAAVQDPAAEPGGRVCFGFAVLTDRGGATIVVADATGYLEVIAQAPDTTWLVPKLLELQAKHKAPIACDRWGASGPAVDELERKDARLLLMSTGDVGNAAAGFLDAIIRHDLRVRPSDVLSEAVAGAAKKPIADTGGFAWSRRASAAPVAALVAASNALWGARHNPPPVRPVVAAL